MKQLMRELCVWLCLLSLALTSANGLKDNFCERNVTVRSSRPVTKQRTVIKQPSKWKVWKKAQTITEVYNAEEEQITHKLISQCCSGYRLTEGGLCEPVCDRGCPAHASCVEPQRCQCTSGFVSALAHRDGSHYCEPVCSQPCGLGARCVAPNTCACRDGYRALAPAGDGVSGPCVPTCQLGDGCANGECVAVERCVCLPGFVWQQEQQRCLPQEATQLVTVDNSEGVTELLQYFSSSTQPEPAITEDCEDGFVLYAGECRPELFDSNEAQTPSPADCRLADVECGQHQQCDKQGRCVCSTGYVEVEADESTSTTVSPLLCRRGLLEQLLSIDQAADSDDELNPLTIPIIGLASGFLFVLLLVGLVTGLRKRGQVEEVGAVPKEELKCEYSQKSYDVDEWVP